MDTGPANILEGSVSAVRKQHAVAPDEFSLLYLKKTISVLFFM